LSFSEHRSFSFLFFFQVKSLSYGAFDHSFGNKNAKGNLIDLPHIVTSLFQGMDRFVVTPPDETPPVLGSDLPESATARKQRRSSSSNLVVDPEATYSFSYNSM
jgi:hypothetical protein